MVKTKLISARFARIAATPAFQADAAVAREELARARAEQVADALGISKTTVSRALSGKGRISEETRAKVYAYMGRTRSEPVSAQRGEKLRTNNIAMIVPQRFITLDLPI